MNLREFCLAIALSLATLVVAVVVAVLGLSFLMQVIIFFGVPTGYLIGLIIPNSLLYQLAPEGGGPAFVGMSLIGAFIQLAVIYSVLIYRMKCARRLSGR
jgi:hypothetical protein